MSLIAGSIFDAGCCGRVVAAAVCLDALRQPPDWLTLLFRRSALFGRASTTSCLVNFVAPSFGAPRRLFRSSLQGVVVSLSSVGDPCSVLFSSVGLL